MSTKTIIEEATICTIALFEKSMLPADGSQLAILGGFCNVADK